MRSRLTLLVAVILLVCLPLGLWGQGAKKAKRAPANPEDITQWHGKTVLYFGPHEDDDLAGAGTMAKLVKGGNQVYVILYTSGNKGSRDLDMTAERLAQIRRQEDLAANKALGIPEDHVLAGGFGSAVLEVLHETDCSAAVERIGWPDRFVEHGSGTEDLRAAAGLSFDAMYRRVRERAVVHRNAPSVEISA